MKTIIFLSKAESNIHFALSHFTHPLTDHKIRPWTRKCSHNKNKHDGTHQPRMHKTVLCIWVRYVSLWFLIYPPKNSLHIPVFIFLLLLLPQFHFPIFIFNRFAVIHTAFLVSVASHTAFRIVGLLTHRERLCFFSPTARRRDFNNFEISLNGW